jgi:hypothetical protein
MNDREIHVCLQVLQIAVLQMWPHTGISRPSTVLATEGTTDFGKFYCFKGLQIAMARLWTGLCDLSNRVMGSLAR